ncbi:ABC transporter ATP-binding protein [Pusillimonas noertemannii]|uniref:NitT/TauT family transport system ATP-binding protein n=1 Tax=Pusillimonas noertemannii TaxID=305977 RepID=A0A2U1CKW1_9BURK|nr:ABC transporter ATP-binding protein [Pusillimonas noertemannii]PVY61631.1 NitT/TauT family transport system ATP-binding protein [Pusillimonas noertemannii]TFL09575.1 ABC transporter ATP-binding protein [Pusillimonas noertemannii]
MAETLVELDNISMAYGDGETAVRAIEDVTLSIQKGEFIAVVGPSGCGKSSLMKLISGLHPPLSGRLAVEGKPVNGPLKSVGMAFQASNLLPWRNCVDNILLPLEIVQPYRKNISSQRAKYKEKAVKLLDSVGLAGFTEKFPWELSGGMQQRASICRALIHEPEILMLDEPFGALDAFTREELWCALRDIQQERQVTVMLVTHDLREAVFLADTVYVMSNRPGRVVKKCPVNLPRPRDLEITYGKEFQEIVYELRSMIGGKH